MIFGGLFFPNIDAYEDSIFVDNFPRDIAIDNNLDNIYVPNYNSGTISIIDSNNMILKETIVLEGNINPTKIVVDSNRHMVFVTDKISGTLTILDGVSGKIIKTIDTEKSLWELDINEKNGKI